MDDGRVNKREFVAARMRTQLGAHKTSEVKKVDNWKHDLIGNLDSRRSIEAKKH